MRVAYKLRFSGTGNPNYKYGPIFCKTCGRKLSRNSVGIYCVHCYAGSPEYKNAFNGKKHSATTREKMKNNHADVVGEKNSFYGHHHSEEVKKEIGRGVKQRWEHGTNEYRAGMIANLLRGIETQRKCVFTKPEREMALILEKMKRPFIHNCLLYNKFFVDFLVGNTVIEVFGDYWHGNPLFFPAPSKTQITQHKKDKSRIAYLAKCGHNVVVFWENEIKKSPEVVAAVTEALLEMKT
jgi:G:T-mismatch repair DNA endonuclease (very short patch repair protein)